MQARDEAVRLLLRFLYHEVHGFTNGLSNMLPLLSRNLDILKPTDDLGLDPQRQRARGQVDEILRAINEGVTTTATLFQKLRILAREERVVQRQPLALHRVCSQLQQTITHYAEADLDLPTTITLAIPLELQLRGEPALLELALHEVLLHTVQESAHTLQGDACAEILVSGERQTDTIIVRIADNASRFPDLLLYHLGLHISHY
jgi:C4-dicarboxylate-specific signal transduction histidine kinase